MTEHTSTRDCWCNPYLAFEEVGGDVWVHNTVEEYLLKELELIGDICVDYDGYRSIDGLKKLVDEIKERAYSAYANVWKEVIND